MKPTAKQIRKARSIVIQIALITLAILIAVHAAPAIIVATAIYLGYLFGMQREATRNRTRKSGSRSRKPRTP